MLPSKTINPELAHFFFQTKTRFTRFPTHLRKHVEYNIANFMPLAFHELILLTRQPLNYKYKWKYHIFLRNFIQNIFLLIPSLKCLYYLNDCIYKI